MFSITEYLFGYSDDANEPGIVYVDFDNHSHSLTYQELKDLSTEFSLELKSSEIQISAVDDFREFSTLSLNFPIVLLFGDTKQYAPVFMFGSNLARLPFMSLNDAKQVQQTQDILKQKLGFQPFGYVIFHQNSQDFLSEFFSCDTNWKVENLSFIPEFMIAKYEDENKNLEPEIKKSKSECTKVDVSYVIRTSGTSSNKPKIVFVPQNCILDNVNSFQETFKPISKTPILVTSPFTFDPSILDLLLGILLRCCVYLISPTVRSNSEAFKRLFRSQNGDNSYKNIPFTYMTITPSLWSQRFGSFFLFKNLKFLNFGGESSPNVGELKPLIENNLNLKIVNFYGLTEMSVWASIFTDSNRFIRESKDLSQILPIGTSVLNTELKLDPSSNQLELVSQNRKCLFLKNSLFVFVETLRTGDIFYKDLDGNLIFKNREKWNDFVKINGKKCYLEDMKKDIFELFQEDQILEQIFVLPSSFNNYPDSVINIILRLSVPVVNIEDIKMKLWNNFFVAKHSEFPLRLKFIRSEEELPLNEHGKLNLNLLTGNNSRSEEFCALPDGKDLKEMFFSCLKNVFQFYEQRIRDSYQKNLTLVELGMDSVQAVQIALNFEKLIGSLMEHFFPILQSEKLQNILESLENFVSSNHASRFSVISDKNLNKIDVKNGLKLKLEWKYFMEECVDAPPLIVQHREYSFAIFASHSGMVAAILIHTGELLWKYNCNTRIVSKPAVSEDKNLIFVCGLNGMMFAFKALTGEFVWNISTGNEIKVPPAIYGNSVFVSSYDCFLYSFQLHQILSHSPKLLWKKNISESPLSSPPVINQERGTILVGTLNKTLFLLNIVDGTVVWKKVLTFPIFSQPIFWKNQILLCTLRNNSLICLFSETGNEAWNVEIEASNFSNPLLFETSDDDFLMFGSLKSFFCFNLNRKQFSWTRETGNELRNYTKFDDESSLIMDINGKFYLGKISGQFDMVELEEKLSFDTNFRTFSTPSYDSRTGSVVFGARDNYGYCLKFI